MPDMIRKAFKMSVYPDQHAEYMLRNNRIWPELEFVHREHGVRSYSIFFDPTTSELFAYAEIESEGRCNAIGATDVCRRWWHYMREITPANPDNSPVSGELKELFTLRPGD